MPELGRAMKGYGWAIRVMRVSRGLSQVEVAIAGGMSPCIVSLYENEKRSPRLRTLGKIAKAIDTTEVQLAYLSGLDSLSVDALSVGECRAIIRELLR